MPGGRIRKHRFGQEQEQEQELGEGSATDFAGVSTRKARQGRVASLGLVSLSDSSRLWGQEAILG